MYGTYGPSAWPGSFTRSNVRATSGAVRRAARSRFSAVSGLGSCWIFSGTPRRAQACSMKPSFSKYSVLRRPSSAIEVQPS
jgi:hypothetical protein